MSGLAHNHLLQGVRIYLSLGMLGFLMGGCTYLQSLRGYVNEAGEFCRPNYIQLSQPPLKLGGSGRIILVPNGEICERIPEKPTEPRGANDKPDM